MNKILITLLSLVLSSEVNSTPPLSFEANPDTKRLYDDLLSNYNRLIRPVVNNTETLTVWLGLKLSQLIEVNLRNQVMTTNLWVKQRWFDYKLRWDPEEYGGVEQLYVPSEHIWVPDIVLYNNWDGNYELPLFISFTARFLLEYCTTHPQVTLMTKATLKYTGEVFWEPPAIYKSSCEMNVEYFPYDEQICFMKFGSWTYNGAQVDLKHLDQVPGSNLVQVGIDLSEFYLSRNGSTAIPEMIENGNWMYRINHVTLCISILVSLTVFFLLLAEIIPPTSLAVPLLGKYLLFTMILVSLSVWTTVCVLNIHFRSPSTHKMSPLVRKLFLHFMPKLMMMRRTKYSLPDYDDTTPSNGYTNEIDVRDSISDFPNDFKDGQDAVYDNGNQNSIDSDNVIPRNLTPEVLQALRAVRFIAQHIKDADKDNERLDCEFCDKLPRNVALQSMCQLLRDSIYCSFNWPQKILTIVEDWKFVSMVLDRFFLWTFTLSCIFGTFAIICQSPSLYDTRLPIDRQLSEIPLRKNNFMLPPDIVRQIVN
uniref:Neurotransmitter-gated ion-channel ligand-binding domain-containing protein n=1 Tax=Glossina palpalis gambiensis TaxID=67801 RepID=A0A1B0BF32_9MUSC